MTDDHRTRVCLRALAGTFLLLACIIESPAQLAVPPLDLPPEGYVCVRSRTPIVVDGRLDEPAWNAAPWSRDFVDIQGAALPVPRFVTRMKMLWDDSCLYVGAWLQEPHVWATLTTRDAVIFHDNDFEVFIDPDGDDHEYYEFEINALNTGWDLRLVKPYRDGGPPVDSWDIRGLSTAVQVHGTLNDPNDRDSGWCVELAFPWKALGEYADVPAPPRTGDQWRINFSRVEWQISITDGRYAKIPGRSEDNWVWSPQGVIDMHRPEMWGIVQFEDTPGKALSPDPSFNARRTLMAVYYAEREYQRLHGAWTDSVEVLGLGQGPIRPAIRLTAEGFEAICPFTDRAGVPARVTVRQDSRIVIERDNGRR